MRSADNWWTAEREATLRRLYVEEGLPPHLIERQMGASSRNVIIGKIHRLGINRSASLYRTRARTKTQALRDNSVTMKIRRHRERKPAQSLPPRESLGAPDSKKLTIYELTNHVCHYIADELPNPLTYCGHDALLGSPWCAFHEALCVQRVSRSEADRRFARAANYR